MTRINIYIGIETRVSILSNYLYIYINMYNCLQIANIRAFEAVTREERRRKKKRKISITETIGGN